MDGFTEGLGPEGIGHSRAAMLFEEMSRLRHIWGGFRPEMPMRRSEADILNTVAHLTCGGRKELTMGDLARRTHQSKPAISQKISDLEARGYLVRTTGKADRRQVKISLTEKGARLAGESLQAYFGKVDQALDSLGGEKAEELVSLMRQLSDALETIMKAQGSDASC